MLSLLLCLFVFFCFVSPWETQYNRHLVASCRNNHGTYALWHVAFFLVCWCPHCESTVGCMCACMCVCVTGQCTCISIAVSRQWVVQHTVDSQLSIYKYSATHCRLTAFDIQVHCPVMHTYVHTWKKHIYKFWKFDLHVQYM